MPEACYLYYHKNKLKTIMQQTPLDHFETTSTFREKFVNFFQQIPLYVRIALIFILNSFSCAIVGYKSSKPFTLNEDAFCVWVGFIVIGFTFGGFLQFFFNLLVFFVKKPTDESPKLDLASYCVIAGFLMLSLFFFLAFVIDIK